MNVDFDWTHLVATVFGGSWATFIFRLLTKRAIDQLDEISKRLGKVLTKIVVIENKIVDLEALKDVVKEHDRKIVALETQMASAKEKS